MRKKLNIFFVLNKKFYICKPNYEPVVCIVINVIAFIAC